MSPERRLVIGFGAVVAAVIAGCGGSGGGGSTSTSTSSTGTSLATTIEARDSDSYAVSTSSLRQGDTFDLILWGRDTSGAIILGTAGDWSTTAPSTIAVVNPAGSLSVTSAGSIPLRALSGTSTKTYTAVSTGGVVRGRVRNTENQGVPSAVVRFYNSAGTQLLTATTGSNGTFRTVVPNTAVTFMVDFSSLGTKYYNQFSYQGKEWGMVCDSYRPALPARSGSSVVTLPNEVIVTRNVGTNPPPPPPDCGL
jgi:hypothetical protein